MCIGPSVFSADGCDAVWKYHCRFHSPEPHVQADPYAGGRTWHAAADQFKRTFGGCAEPARKEFLQVDRKWEGIMKDFDQVRCAAEITEVSIGAVDRINNFTLRDFTGILWTDIMTSESDAIRGIPDSFMK